MAATLALVLGTAAGFSVSRFARFPGRLLFGFALLAPLVVPEIILGLSLLLLLSPARVGSVGRAAAS
jgi:putrescine transport system permease protein